MKKLLSLFTVLMFACLAVASAAARPANSLDFFYNSLAPYGTWREVGDYGWSWQPDKVPNDWRPYSDGRWVYTDAGWTWASKEPYSWAVYHYGRWANVEGAGWVWVPDQEWGPAWVSWRGGKDFVGWVPLPPEARFNRSVGFSDWVDDYFDLGPENYVFVHARDVGNEHLNSVIVDRAQNLAIVSNTTNLTRITFEDGVVHNGGPGYDDMAKVSSVPMKRFQLERHQEAGVTRQPPGEGVSKIEGTTLRVFAPVIEGKAASPPGKMGEKVETVVINHGWKKAGSPAEVAEARLRMKGQSPLPPGLPPKAVVEKPVSISEDKPVPAEKPPAPKAEKRLPGDLPPGTDSSAQPREPQLPPVEEPPVKPGPMEVPGSVKPLPGEGVPRSEGTTRMPKPIDTPPASPGVEPKIPETKPQVPEKEPVRPGIYTPPPVSNPQRPTKPGGREKGARPVIERKAREISPLDV